VPPVSAEMLIDAVDHRDQPVGLVRRKDVFARGVNFRVVHCLVFNGKRELLIQRIGRRNTRHPGYWGSSVAGYMFAHESYEEAGKRRLRQELGISGIPLTFVGKTSMEDEGCEKFIGVFTVTYDGPVTFDRDHIDSVQFLGLTDVDRATSDRRSTFTPTFLRVLSFYESRM